VIEGACKTQSLIKRNFLFTSLTNKFSRGFVIERFLQLLFRCFVALLLYGCSALLLYCLTIVWAYNIAAKCLFCVADLQLHCLLVF
jgi:hypothetical protein